jgi:hypothetical protein
LSILSGRGAISHGQEWGSTFEHGSRHMLRLLPYLYELNPAELVRFVSVHFSSMHMDTGAAGQVLKTRYLLLLEVTPTFSVSNTDSEGFLDG